MEDNNIDSWDEIVEFRHLPSLKRITLNKNRIQDIYYKPGFNELYMISIEDNLISKWATIDALNEFAKLSELRVTGNPLFAKDSPEKKTRESGIARV